MSTSSAIIVERTLEEHFVDWESYVFGFGYGSGEPHVLPALRMFLDKCRLDDTSAYDHTEIERELGGTVTWLLINALGCVNIIEYGTSPRYGWLTKEGIALRDFMTSRSADDLVTLVCASDDPALCTPTFCNCGPAGYSNTKLCHSPFWKERSGTA